MTGFPVDAVLGEVKAALAGPGAAVLIAPPGAGKTTRVPPALLAEAWLAGARIVMLEPRRIAARAAASFMAKAMGEEVGVTVGYAMRFERCVSRGTRIEVVTEGTLVRRLQADPALAGVGLVILDEIHERSLDADTSLALLLDLRLSLRPELRLLAMSATADAAAIARALGDAPVIETRGRSFPVTLRHAPPRPGESLEAAVARVVRRALAEAPGDLLAFLPGAAVIRAVAERLGDGLDPSIVVHRLTGESDRAAQDAALAPARPGTRKVVLATNVAETSLTVPGVRIVVDSGLVRRPVLDPGTGLVRLVTQRIDRSAATQRSGRAGRTAPGVAWRLWPAEEERGMAQAGRPEILDADLAGLVLDLAAWGVADPAALPFPTPPPTAALERARALLGLLGALAADGRLTPIGRRMAALPLEPRLARLVTAGEETGAAPTARALAALLALRDPFERAATADLAWRLERLAGAGRAAETGLVRQVMAQLGGSGPIDPARAGSLLAVAFPDRIGQRRGPGTFQLVSGRRVVIDPLDPLAAAPWIVAAAVRDGPREGRVELAAMLDEAGLRSVTGARQERVTSLGWDEARRRVVAETVTRLGALVLDRREAADADPAAVRAALIAAILSGRVALRWDEAAERSRARLAWLKRLDPAAPAVDDAALLDRLEDWLGPVLWGVASQAELHRQDPAQALLAWLTPEQRRVLERDLPARWSLPSGRQIAIDYRRDSPTLAVRLQELLGLDRHPALAGGRLPLVVELLSPAGRPIAVTGDLPRFWRETYPQLRKELRGRYPKHAWPEDPLAVPGAARAAPRGG